MIETVNVDLGDRSYPILIAPGQLDVAASLQAHVSGKQVLIVTDARVAALYLDRVRDGLGNLHVAELVLQGGEEEKTLACAEQIFDKLIAERFNRGCTVVALGGGVVGDVAGFAAACYQRGVGFVQIPTTLLAQVDSSVGGKTAVNHPGGKNMIGAFYQPSAVVIDTATLSTLPAREVRAGLAEVIKYGVLWDEHFFIWLEAHIEALLERDAPTLAEAIKRSCEIKAEIVGQDERETDLRALLNLGHTFGHAIEAGLGYGRWLHGEAVGAGIAMAADMSRREGLIDTHACERIERLLQRAELDIRYPDSIEPARMLELMGRDKKATDEGIRLILIERIGRAFVTDDYEHANLMGCLEHCASATTH